MRFPGTIGSFLLLNWAAALFALAMVWLPELRAYWASPLLISSSTVVQARAVPPDPLLSQIADQSLGLPLHTPGAPDGRHPEIVAVADRLLSGSVQFPKLPPVSLLVPFDERNLTTGPPTHRLYIASMATADILIRAYRQSGNERYLRAAGQEISAFAKVDRGRLLPIGLLWNDHALAAMIPVLVDYWANIRHRADLDPDHAREVLSLVSRSTTRLARTGNYTFRTNHGLMQSIALLQVAAAFPSLETSQDVRALACTRIAEQSEYYLSAEGPVLEHSAGYHMMGLYLFRILDELGPEHGCTPAPGFSNVLDLAREFASLLRRPNGTLPTLGDTDLAENYDASLVGSGSPLSTSGFYPASGFAVRWDGLEQWPLSSSLAQTVMTWSNFPSGAHKLADDLSVFVWAHGEDWLLNTGYWPFGYRGGESARGWAGSNAPHMQGEAADSPRRSIVRGFSETDRVWSIDVERTTPGAAKPIRRQIVAIDGRTWLIIDSGPADADRPLSSVWTFTPDKRVSALSTADYLIRSSTTDNAARMTILPGEGLRAENRKGSLAPFAGWIVRNGTPTATESIVVRQEQARQPTVTVLLLSENRQLMSLPAPTLRKDSTADNWEVAFASGWGVADVISRNGAVHVNFADGSIQPLNPRSDFSEAEKVRTAIVTAYRSAVSRSDRTPQLLPYRIRLTWVLFAVFVAQELAIFALRRARPQAVSATRVAAGFAWIVVGLVAANWYLVK